MVEQIDKLKPLTQITANQYAEHLVEVGKAALKKVSGLNELGQQDAVTQAIRERINAIVCAAKRIGKRRETGSQFPADLETNRPLSSGKKRKKTHRSLAEDFESGDQL